MKGCFTSVLWVYYVDLQELVSSHYLLFHVMYVIYVSTDLERMY